MINVTKTYLPPLDRYLNQLKNIWQSGWITNNGLLVKELAEKLCCYLQLPNIELVANGTLALQLAIKVLKLQGEVITSAYGYVATTAAIIWEGCAPEFVDIEDKTFCIDADQIEDAITEQTSAILATHEYGYPCNVEKIGRIAQKYGLKVIYDAAHAFGVKFQGKSILCNGDISALSFHATKLFHSAEGGAVICKDENLAKRIGLTKKLGYIGEDDHLELGINAKMTELQAAMGLCVLPNVKEDITKRRKLSEHYDSRLQGHGLIRPIAPKRLEYNYAYYPVIFPSHENMISVRQTLIENGIMPRRYFYPSLNALPYLRPEWKRPCPVSESVANRVLCLPIYFGLGHDEIDRICKIVLERMQ
jgi:dTDP-4-amino-4,6-dideoxygalactose transaminase